jgi:hypothetical protein
MPGEIERFIKIQNPDPGRTALGSRGWHTIPNCDRLSIWEQSVLVVHDEDTGLDERRFFFHVRFVDGIRKGSRVTFLGNHFSVLTVSDSKRLVGLEICCASDVQAPLAAQPMEVRKQSLRR